MKHLAIAAFLLVMASGVHAETVTIRDSQGGLINEFSLARYGYEKAGISVRIAGMCRSACAIYTGMKNVCVEEGAYFDFHQGTNRTATYLTMHLMDPDLRAYVENYGEPLPPNRELLTFGREDRAPSYFQAFLYLSAEEAIEKGMMAKCL